MKRILCCFLAAVIIFSSCSRPFSFEAKSAEEVLCEIMKEFSITDGYIYSSGEEAEHPITSAMLERMFFGTALDDLRYAESMAVYFSRRFSEREIIIIELFDMSHRKAVMALLTKRAEKKENAIVQANGNYVYLICTEKNEEILSALLGNR